MADVISFPGVVEWSGENPGISLKESPDGPFVSLASFFRVVLSPYGRGHALVLLQSPQQATPPAGKENYCFYDNLELARFVVSDFLKHFGAYRGLPSVDGMSYRQLDRVQTSGGTRGTYTETVVAGDLTVALSWSELGEPFCFALPPDKSATGKHHMPSLFIGSGRATITVNGRVLPGKPVPREFAGRSITTAMLAFSETWIRS